MGRLNARFPLYSRLLGLYPVAYRKQYAEQTLQTLADMLDGAQDTRTRQAIWVNAALELPINITRQQLTYLGELAVNQFPPYFKPSVITGAALLTPFLVILLINAWTSHGLYHTWLWSFPVLLTWIVILPALASIIAGTAFVTWLVERRQQNISVWRSLLDIKRSWPVLVILLFGLGILALVFGHDKVQCVTLDPRLEWHDWQNTWHCIRQN